MAKYFFDNGKPYNSIADWARNKGVPVSTAYSYKHRGYAPFGNKPMPGRPTSSNMQSCRLDKSCGGDKFSSLTAAYKYFYSLNEQKKIGYHAFVKRYRESQFPFTERKKDV